MQDARNATIAATKRAAGKTFVFEFTVDGVVTRTRKSPAQYTHLIAVYGENNGRSAAWGVWGYSKSSDGAEKTRKTAARCYPIARVVEIVEVN